jgi:cytochrome c-type biogenesis protein
VFFIDISVALLVFLDGIATFISPCLLPLLPIYIFYLTGSSAENYNEEIINKKNLIINSLGFIIGFSIIFMILGAAVFSLSTFLLRNRNIVRIISGIIIIMFGLNFIGIFKLGILDFEKRINYGLKELHFFSSILFGIVFGFAWTPCGSKYLAVALGFAANVNTLFNGVLLLLLYSLGLGIPLLITAIIFDKIKNSFKKIMKYNKVINILSGIILVAAGVLLIFDRLYF